MSIEAAKTIHSASKDVTIGDVVEFLGDPAKVAELREHVASSGEADDSGTPITIVTITVIASC